MTAFTNDLALYFYSGIVIAVADMLQQVWNVWARALRVVLGQVPVPFPQRLFLRIMGPRRDRIIGDTKRKARRANLLQALDNQ